MLYVFGGNASGASSLLLQSRCWSKLVFTEGSSVDAVVMSDLHQFDPVSRTWTELVGLSADGARYAHCFTAIDERLFVFGGVNIQGPESQQANLGMEAQ